MANDDMVLLREYARENSEQAFGTLVSRHVNLVYTIALRQLRDPHLAEEITQVVFIILARKAGDLSSKTILSGWLCRTARYASANALKIRHRRQQHEQEAQMQSIANESESDPWNQIAPLLDAAMAGLSEADHNAIVLRFFDGKNLREVGDALGASEEAAKKRVNRAVDKLRKFFVRRGITLSAVAIAGALSTQSLYAAPGGLAASVVAATKGTAAATSMATLIQSTLSLMAWTKAKIAAAAGAAAVLAIGTAVVVVKTTGATGALEPPDIQGAWTGVVEDAKAHLRNRGVVKISKTNGTYHATVDLIDQNQKDIPFTRFVYDYPSVRGELKFPSGNAVWKATLNSSATELSGTWKDRETIPLVLKRTDAPDAVPDPLLEKDYAPRRGSELQGYWKGTLASMPVALKIVEETGGTFRAQFDSVQEGMRNIPIDITYSRPAIKADLNGFGASFKGSLDPGGTRIRGSWTVPAGTVFPLILERANSAADAAREKAKSYGYSGPDDLPSHWKGIISTRRNGSKVNLPLVLHLARLPDGTFAASLDSPDEIGKTGIEASAVQYLAPNLHVHWIGIGSFFEAKLQNGKLTGIWRDDHGTHAIVFERR